jgi:hypothetical protein
MERSAAAVRNEKSRQRKRDRGLIRTEVEVYEEDREKLHEFAAILRTKREIQQQDRQQ